MTMIKLEYTEEITAVGLSREQAVVYETLLKTGVASPVSVIAKAIPTKAILSRPLVYKILEELLVLDLVEKDETSSKVARFKAKHPVAIMKVIDEQKSRIEHAKKQFLVTEGKLSSLFNLSAGKPGVQFFEGKDGVWEVLMDSLGATEEILTYADLEAIEKYIPELNAEYSVLREEKGVKKRGLVLDSKLARDFLRSYDQATTTVKLIKENKKLQNFNTVVQIYDQKVSYLTLTDQYLVGIIISDRFIADTHKYLFESLWENSAGEIV